MQMIFERESRREKNLEVAKKKALENKTKPVKKDPASDIAKQQEVLSSQLNELEETFFGHVADDSEHLEAIKQRGANLRDMNESGL